MVRQSAPWTISLNVPLLRKRNRMVIALSSADQVNSLKLLKCAHIRAGGGADRLPGMAQSKTLLMLLALWHN